MPVSVPTNTRRVMSRPNSQQATNIEQVCAVCQSAAGSAVPKRPKQPAWVGCVVCVLCAETCSASNGINEPVEREVGMTDAGSKL